MDRRALPRGTASRPAPPDLAERRADSGPAVRQNGDRQSSGGHLDPDRGRPPAGSGPAPSESITSPSGSTARLCPIPVGAAPTGRPTDTGSAWPHARTYEVESSARARAKISHCSTLARPGPPRRCHDDHLGAVAGQPLEQAWEPDVVTGGEADAHAVDLDGHEVRTWRDRRGLLETERVEEMDLVVRRVEARAGREQRVPYAITVRREHADHHGHAGPPGRSRARGSPTGRRAARRSGASGTPKQHIVASGRTTRPAPAAAPCATASATSARFAVGSSDEMIWASATRIVAPSGGRRRGAGSGHARVDEDAM